MRHRLGVIIAIAVIIAGGLAIAAYYIYEGNNNDEDQTQSQLNDETQSDNSNSSSTQLASETITYQVTFNVNWSQETHAASLPPNPHMSPMVVVAHASEDELFKSGDEANNAIEQVAETGATSLIKEELENKLASDQIFDFKIGKRVDAPGSDNVEITVNQSVAYLSFISMIAPSPDWIVGLANIELLENGEFINTKTIDVRTYDAGTDSGTTFTAEDTDTQPRELISSPVDQQFITASETPFGTITIERI